MEKGNFVQRRNISNQLAPLVVIDFDALVKAPEPGWGLKVYEWLRDHRWTRWLFRKLLPFYISRYKLTREAETAGWWLVDKGLRIEVLVRAPYAAGLVKAVEHVLGEFPNSGFHLVPSPDYGGQAMDVHQYCRGERALRFYTRDKELAKYLPTSLVIYVDQWDASILR
jgi:hypothetical protein